MIEKLASIAPVPTAQRDGSKHMSKRKEAGVGFLVAAVFNAVVWIVFASAMSTEHRLIVMGGTNEVLGVLMIASPELGEILESARDYLRGLFLLGKFHLIFLYVSRRVRDASQRSAVLMLVLHGLTLRFTTLTGRVADAIASEPPDGLKALWAAYRADREKAAREAEIYARKLVDRHLPLRLLGILLVVVGLVVGLLGHIHSATATTTITTTATATTTTTITATTTIKQVPVAPRAFMWFGETWTASKLTPFEQESFRHGHTHHSLRMLYIEHPTVREVFGLRR
jgi:hypothetical protein